MFDEISTRDGEPRSRSQPGNLQRLAPVRHSKLSVRCQGVVEGVGALGVLYTQRAHIRLTVLGQVQVSAWRGVSFKM